MLIQNKKPVKHHDDEIQMLYATDESMQIGQRTID